MTIGLKGKRFTVMALCAVLAVALAAGGLYLGMANRPAIGAVPEAAWRDFAASFSKAEAYSPAQPLGFSLNMKDMQDRPVAWTAFRGNVTLVNFWALWCTPCLRELPSLHEMERARAGTGLDVAYISMDYPENAEQLKSVMALKKTPDIQTLYVSDTDSWSALKLTALPTTVILDRKGRIAYRLHGDIDWNGPEAVAFLDAVSK